MPQRRLPDISDDQLYAEWIEWIERIYNETVELAWNRRVFRDIGRVFQYNTHLQERGGSLWDWMRTNYIAGAAMSFRREVDRQGGTLNLRNLLFEIEKRPGVMSRRRYYEKWGPATSPFQEQRRVEAFELFKPVSVSDDDMDDHIDPSLVRQDRVELESNTKFVQDFVEQTIAHRGRGGMVTVSMQRFNETIDGLMIVVEKYLSMLTLNSVAQFEPAPQYNTHEPFTFPWDVTCDGMWQEFMDGKKLPWKRILDMYEAEPK